MCAPLWDHLQDVSPRAVSCDLTCLLSTSSIISQSFCILSIPCSSVFLYAVLSLQSLISSLQRSQALKQHLYGPVFVCVVWVCVGSVVHSGVVSKGVSPRSNTHPSVFLLFFFSPIFFCSPLSPEWSSVLQSVENLCFQLGALLPPAHLSVCVYINLCEFSVGVHTYANLSVVSGA